MSPRGLGLGRESISRLAKCRRCFKNSHDVGVLKPVRGSDRKNRLTHAIYSNHRSVPSEEIVLKTRKQRTNPTYRILSFKSCSSPESKLRLHHNYSTIFFFSSLVESTCRHVVYCEMNWCKRNVKPNHYRLLKTAQKIFSVGFTFSSVRKTFLVQHYQ